MPRRIRAESRQDITAEQCVPGGMLLSKDAIADVVEMLRAPDFYRSAHQSVYDIVLDLYGRGGPADAVTVAAELTKRGKIAASVAPPSSYSDRLRPDRGERVLLRPDRP